MAIAIVLRTVRANDCHVRIVEEDIESAIEARNEALQTIRELGPPDLVHLIKQSKSGGRQVKRGGYAKHCRTLAYVL